MRCEACLEQRVASSLCQLLTGVSDLVWGLTLGEGQGTEMP